MDVEKACVDRIESEFVNGCPLTSYWSLSSRCYCQLRDTRTVFGVEGCCSVGFCILARWKCLRCTRINRLWIGIKPHTLCLSSQVPLIVRFFSKPDQQGIKVARYYLALSSILKSGPFDARIYLTAIGSPPANPDWLYKHKMNYLDNSTAHGYKISHR